MGLRYKFVEISTVADDVIEGVVNEWVSQGWSFDGIRFVMGEASRRPVMAFISFTRDIDETAEELAPVAHAGNPLARLAHR